MMMVVVATRRALTITTTLPARRLHTSIAATYSQQQFRRPRHLLSLSLQPADTCRPRPRVSSTHLVLPRRRIYSTAADEGDLQPQPQDYLSETEKKIFYKLRKELGPSKLEVQDISGGCGSMFAIEVASSRFRGMSIIKQHRLVNEVLADEIKAWHGLQLKTKVD